MIARCRAPRCSIPPKLRPIALLAGRTPLEGRATAYVCECLGCRQPVCEPDELVALLAASA